MHSAEICSSAQVANQKALFVAKALNLQVRDKPLAEPFTFKNAGTLAYLGDWSAIFEGPKNKDKDGFAVTGRAAFAVWRSAYFLQTLSLRNKILVPFYWFFNWCCSLYLSPRNPKSNNQYSWSLFGKVGSRRRHSMPAPAQQQAIRPATSLYLSSRQKFHSSPARIFRLSIFCHLSNAISTRHEYAVAHNTNNANFGSLFQFLSRILFFLLCRTSFFILFCLSVSVLLRHYTLHATMRGLNTTIFSLTLCVTSVLCQNLTSFADGIHDVDPLDKRGWTSIGVGLMVERSHTATEGQSLLKRALAAATNGQLAARDLPGQTPVQLSLDERGNVVFPADMTSLAMGRRDHHMSRRSHLSERGPRKNKSKKRNGRTRSAAARKRGKGSKSRKSGDTLAALSAGVSRTFSSVITWCMFNCYGCLCLCLADCEVDTGRDLLNRKIGYHSNIVLLTTPCSLLRR